MGNEAGLTAVLTEVHRRIEALWQTVREGLADDAELASAWRGFSEKLRDHIRDEEEVLFPAFEERVGMGPEAGPTAVMRNEHRELEALIEELETAWRSGGRQRARQMADQLESLMEAHDEKEERVLYPMMEGAFGTEEATALVGRLQTLKA